MQPHNIKAHKESSDLITEYKIARRNKMWRYDYDQRVPKDYSHDVVLDIAVEEAAAVAGGTVRLAGCHVSSISARKN